MVIFGHSWSLLRPWQTRTHCCRHIVADTNVSPFARARNICCGHKFCVRDTKMFLILFRNILCPQQMFPSLRSPRNIMGNNVSSFTRAFKVLANEDTLLPTHCCRHKCFPVCPRAQHLLRTQILCPGHKNVSDFVQKHFVSTTNVPQFAQPKKHHEQQCVRNNVSSFTRAFSHSWSIVLTRAYSGLLVATRGHSWSLVSTFSPL